jgi:hypothetical protein
VAIAFVAKQSRDGPPAGRLLGRQLDRELGDVPASKAVVRVDADRWLLMGESSGRSILVIRCSRLASRDSAITRTCLLDAAVQQAADLGGRVNNSSR